MSSIADMSTRNQLRGTVTDVLLGEVMAEASVDVSGDEFVAAITKNSAERLGLASGDEVTVLVKATEVMIAKGKAKLDNLSTRNQIPGKVTKVETGPAMAEVVIDTAAGELVAAVTRKSVDRLELAAGDDVVA